MSPEFKARLCDLIGGRMIFHDKQLNKSQIYKEAYKDCEKRLEDFGKINEELKPKIGEYIDSVNYKESIEFTEAYLLGMRDCIKLIEFLKSTEPLH